MKEKIDIKQFQLVQKGANRYVLKLNCDASYLNERSLLEEYKKILGVDAIIEIEYLSNIPLLSSGKRRILINEYLAN